MPGAGRAEIYFIVGMMILILIVCGVTLVFFAKTYKKEMRERQHRMDEKSAKAPPSQRKTKESCTKVY